MTEPKTTSPRLLPSLHPLSLLPSPWWVDCAALDSPPLPGCRMSPRVTCDARNFRPDMSKRRLFDSPELTCTAFWRQPSNGVTPLKRRSQPLQTAGTLA